MSHIPNHYDRMVDFLISQFQGKENLEKILFVISKQIQEIEDTIRDLRLFRAIDTAEGAQLDQLGDLVGEPRIERTDTQYRDAIKFRIFVNTSKGRYEEIITFILQVTDAENVIITEHFPAKLSITTDGDVVGLGEQIDELMAGGVGLESITSVPPDFDGFVFSEASGPDDEDVSDPSAFGGFFAEVNASQVLTIDGDDGAGQLSEVAFNG
jgi:hypothetical protein